MTAVQGPSRTQFLPFSPPAIGEEEIAEVVDTLRGQQDIVIKALGASLAGVRGFAGASELGDARIALVLDPGALIEEASMGSDTERGERLRLHG